ncbi:hypothetical protein A6A04_02675 [Paramagnetospirillum marisnigri]|uniref:protein O-GlcNAc transferase n=1 Tax=Paramagnetospirillum marisnigri TaxID=1285242 RepID=A0A178MNW3_9PROT|nr:glycosyltransferase family 41 protein [Paramagnetospirillum marisnigri]OAN50319.1 hypothetical protein A6A04_02675 [Paramagnetospirillum marisnigri]
MAGSTTLRDIIAEGVAHHRAGRLAEADRIYRAALDLDPNHPEANHNLGMVVLQVGRPDLALPRLRAALQAKPSDGRFWLSLAEALVLAGQPAEAVALIDQGRRNGLAGVAVDQMAARADTALAADQLFTQALDHHTGGRAAEAEADYRRALAAYPDHAASLANLGALLKDLGRAREAEAPCRRAVALRPGLAEGHNNLGAVLLDLGRPDEAEACFRQALALNPDYPRAQRNLGNALKRQGRRDEAADAYRRLVELTPGQSEPLVLLGMALREAGHLTEAAASLGRAEALRPDQPGLAAELGMILIAAGRLDEAEAALSRALALAPDQADISCALAGVLLPLGRFNEAVALLEDVVTRHPRHVRAHKNLLLALAYGDQPDPEAAFAAPRRFGTIFAAATAPHTNSRDPERRLRIGYLSSDFRAHSVARNLVPQFLAHDHDRFAIHGYADVERPDEATASFRALCDGWRSITGLDDDEAAWLIRDDGIDILVSLAGRFDKNRPAICAQRPAPLQISFHDIATSGLEAMDYLLADRVLAPPNSPERFTERILRLPHFYMAEAPQYPPAIHPPSGPVVFGCFNNPAKLTPAVLGLWAELLSRCPESRLFLKYFNWFESGALRARVVDALATRGVAAERLMIHTQVGDTGHHLDLYNAVDIALDPFPFAGSTTSFEALVMGVPVVTLRGATMAGRWGASMLTSLGLPELIAESPAHYVEIALALAADGNRNPARRHGLRHKLLHSPLCDGVGRTRQIERLYRAVWRRWCKDRPSNA